jgi:acyl-[acyl-carrier-protein]-phospholipid O-acyltransferase/long-chain-fatty-acid--[acyl-carrier-protein] ligase
MLKNILRAILTFLYRVEVKGVENYHDAGKRVLIVANHQSFLDALLIAVFLPEKPMFAINTYIAQKWWIKPFLALADTFALNPTNPMATKSLIDEMKKDRKCVIFPEGRITVTGSLMKVYEGPGMIADKSNAMVLPVRIDGAQYTPFSRLRGKVRIHWFPQITLHMLPPHHFHVDENLKGRQRREAISNHLFDLMSEMLFDTSRWHKPLLHTVIDCMHIHGGNHVIAEDIKREPMTYRQLLTRSLVLGRKIADRSEMGEFVGVLLPNMNTTLVTFLALHAFGRVPAMINFSTGAGNVTSACTTACLKQCLTSRQFIETAKLDAIVDAVEAAGTKVIYLEDIAETVDVSDKLGGLLAAWLPSLWSNRLKHITPQSPAVVLFTSGSEGVPKAVVLSHENLLANRYQIGSRVDFGPKDIVFNVLPMFHSFGLTGATILPLTSGIRIFFYPSPLHYRIVPELVYDTNATILFGTDTFLGGYAKFAHPYDFYSVRYIFAGAEKLKDETRRTWSEKYGVRVFEGYGATETAPVISVNTPMQNKPGSVGRLMPGLEHKLESVQGVEEGGKLIVRGPNVMLGYMLANNPGTLVPPHYTFARSEDQASPERRFMAESADSAGNIPNLWYDTGDIVKIDEKGYVSIQGRAKRFAKIGGEMVSLAAVEQFLSTLWPDYHHAVVNLPDEKKGEQLVLVTDKKDARREDIVRYTRDNGIGELSVPRTIKIVDAVPLLGTGKTDYQGVKTLAEAEISGETTE